MSIRKAGNSSSMELETEGPKAAHLWTRSCREAVAKQSSPIGKCPLRETKQSYRELKAFRGNLPLQVRKCTEYLTFCAGSLG